MKRNLIFLSNFEKRMEKLSYTYLVDQQLFRKASILDQFGFDKEDMINIVYSTLCFIMDMTLKDEDCLMDYIILFLKDILPEYYDVSLDMEESSYEELARYIIVKVLRNDGKPFNFKIKNYTTGKTEILNYYLIKSQPSMEDKTISSYKLTEEGYRLLLNTFETDQRLQVELQSIILTESIKRRNFKNAISTIRQMDNIIRVQIDNVKEMIKQIKENIFAVKINHVSSIYSENINVIKNQKEGLLKIERLIMKSQEDIRNAETIEAENMEALNDLAEMKTYIDRLIEQSTIMVDYHFDLKNEYLNALKTISQTFNSNHLSFSKSYIEPIEDDVRKLDNMNLLIQPLIKPEISKHMNYNKIFEEFKIIQEDSNDADVSIDAIQNEESLEEAENRRIKETYRNAVVMLFEKILKYQDLERFTMMDILSNLTEDEYRTIIPTIRTFTEIVVYLFRLGTLELSSIYEKNKDSFFDSSSKFDITESLLEFIITNNLSSSNMKISFSKIEDEQIEINEIPDNELVRYKADMNNIQIIVENRHA